MNFFLRFTAFAIVGMITSPLLAEGVRVTRLTPENYEEVMPEGKEVDAIHGDLVLENDYVKAVIAQPIATRNANMTVRNIAGCLIDYTVQQAPNDQLSCYYPGSQNYPFRSWKVTDRNGEELLLDDELPTARELFAIEVHVKAEPAEGRAGLTVVYRLDADSRSLSIKQIFENPHDSEVKLQSGDQIRFDTGKEEARKTPNGTADLYYIDDQYWGQAYGLTAQDHEITSRSNSRVSTLQYEDFTQTIPAGESTTLNLDFYVAGNLCEVEILHAKAEGKSLPETATLTLIASGRRLPNARVTLTRDGEYAGTLWTDGSGRIDQTMLPGKYDLELTFCGVSLGEGFSISVNEMDNIFELNSKLETGTLDVEIVDGNGEPIPCKLELIRPEDQPPIDFGPETAITRVRNLLYLVNGRDRVLLPAGDYEVIVSRGPEYDALFLETSLKDNETTKLTGKLERTVDTTGWVSTEYHSHSSPSGDNTSHQMGRVVNLVCEHLEFAPCTEHNRIDTYDDHIESLKLREFISTCSGMELTGSPLPLNHQNAFPLDYHPGKQDGGAPVTDTNPTTQIQRVALWDDRSEKLVQQNHPDIGWLFYDKDGDGQADGGFEGSFPFIHAIEIHPLANAIELGRPISQEDRIRNNRVFNWLQLLNQGYRITGVINTDAHYNFHGSGGRRNWVKSSTDEAGEIETMEMVRNSKQGHLVMSNGPFLTVTASAPDSEGPEAIPGDEIAASSGNVELDIQVQCPNWFDIDRVFVLENGRLVEALNFSREKQAAKFGEGVVKFKQTLTHQLENDGHLIVVAAGSNSRLGPVAGPNWGRQPPVAVSNPIFIDVDGNGFQPNDDVIDDGLPVKGE